MEDRPKKSYNIGAEMYRQGIIPMESEMNMDDMELVEELDLSPSLAYTPSINKAAAEAQRQRNIRNGMTEGLTKSKAIKVADKAYNEARKLARKIIR
ncbi:hypothetical protein N9I05_01545 [Pseudomonadales bacterium]|nr:hypothetical protein [Pseudomonadales bacterium]